MPRGQAFGCFTMVRFDATAQPFFSFALMPRGQLLSYVTKVTSSSSQPIVRRLQLALLGEPCTGAVDQITDLDSTAKDTLKRLRPLRIPSALVLCEINRH